MEQRSSGSLPLPLNDSVSLSAPQADEDFDAAKAAKLRMREIEAQLQQCAAAAANAARCPPQMRVGNSSRAWVEGRVSVFDDSFDHEVWNGCSAPRAVLLIDVWHPELSLQEREAVRQHFGFENSTWWSRHSPWGKVAAQA